jgi:DNA-binding PadR family transcriptional regulator
VRSSGKLREAVLDYLTTHPHAKDTVEGIHSYWLPMDLRMASPGLLREVLDDLVKQGWLTASRPYGSEKLYMISRQQKRGPSWSPADGSRMVH